MVRYRKTYRKCTINPLLLMIDIGVVGVKDGDDNFELYNLHT